MKKEKVLSPYPIKGSYLLCPETLEDFKPVGEIDNVEDLYLTGRWVEQFSRPVSRSG